MRRDRKTEIIKWFVKTRVMRGWRSRTKPVHETLATGFNHRFFTTTHIKSRYKAYPFASETIIEESL